MNILVAWWLSGSSVKVRMSKGIDVLVAQFKTRQ